MVTNSSTLSTRKTEHVLIVLGNLLLMFDSFPVVPRLEILCIFLNCRSFFFFTFRECFCNFDLSRLISSLGFVGAANN